MIEVAVLHEQQLKQPHWWPVVLLEKLSKQGAWLPWEGMGAPTRKLGKSSQSLEANISQLTSRFRPTLRWRNTHTTSRGPTSTRNELKNILNIRASEAGVTGVEGEVRP